MDDSEMDVKIEVSAQVNPSEDERKVTRALANILEAEYLRRGDVISGSGLGRGALKNLYDKIRARRTLSVVRRLLLRNMTGGSTHAYLNRQAAFVGSIVFCDKGEVSPLGPIVLTVRWKRIVDFVNWLAPED